MHSANPGEISANPRGIDLNKIAENVQLFKRNIMNLRTVLVGFDKRFFEPRLPEIGDESFVTPPVRILVCWNTRFGKSTFVSKFVGKLCGIDGISFLPVGHGDFTTKSLWRVRYSKERKILVVGTLRTHPIIFKTVHEIKEINKGISDMINEKKDLYGVGELKEIVIELDCDGLKCVEITDSPGFGCRPELDDLVRRGYDDYDMIIYTTSARGGDGGFHSCMNDEIERITECDQFVLPGQVTFVVTNIDSLIGDGEEEKGDTKPSVEEAQGNLEIELSKFREKFVSKLCEILHKKREYVLEKYPNILFCTPVIKEKFVLEDFYLERFNQATRQIKNYILGTLFQTPMKYYLGKYITSLDEYFNRFQGEVLVKEIQFMETKRMVNNVVDMIGKNYMKTFEENLTKRLMKKQDGMKFVCERVITTKTHEEASQIINLRMMDFMSRELKREFTKLTYELGIYEKMKELSADVLEILAGAKKREERLRRFLLLSVAGGGVVAGLGYLMHRFGIRIARLAFPISKVSIIEKAVASEMIDSLVKEDNEDLTQFAVDSGLLSQNRLKNLDDATDSHFRLFGLLEKICRSGDRMFKSGTVYTLGATALYGFLKMKDFVEYIRKTGKFDPSCLKWRKRAFEEIWKVYSVEVIPKFVKRETEEVLSKISFLVDRELKEIAFYEKHFSTIRKKWLANIPVLEKVELDLLDMKFKLLHRLLFEEVEEEEEEEEEEEGEEEEEEEPHLVVSRGGYKIVRCPFQELSQEKNVLLSQRRIRFMNMARLRIDRSEKRKMEEKLFPPPKKERQIRKNFSIRSEKPFKHIMPLGYCYRPDEVDKNNTLLYKSAVVFKEPGPCMSDLIFRREVQLEDTVLLELMIGITESLKEIHSLGVIHRMLTPDCFHLQERSDESPRFHVWMTKFGSYEIFGKKILKELAIFSENKRSMCWYQDYVLLSDLLNNEGENLEGTQSLERDVFSLGVILAQVWSRSADVFTSEFSDLIRERSRKEEEEDEEEGEEESGDSVENIKVIHKEKLRRVDRDDFMEEFLNLLGMCTDLDRERRGRNVSCSLVVEQLKFLKELLDGVIV